MVHMGKPMKVGLDLDGVILYNPARIVRPIIKSIKHIILPQREHTFYIPNKPWEQQFWRLLHHSSLFVAPGFQEFKDLSKNGLIELYIITARFSFLKKDFVQWMQSIDAKGHNITYFHNVKNEQPHLYKEQKIKELGLDFFVEDNWDIVSHLNKTLPNTNVIWMRNILDRYIAYPLSVSSLNQAATIVKAHL